MYCEIVEKIDASVYSVLIGMATVRGINVYEIDGPDSVSGIFYDYKDEGIKAKVFMVSRKSDKEYNLARLLTNYVLSKNIKGYIVLKEGFGSREISQKADRMAKRLVALLERKCRRKERSQ